MPRYCLFGNTVNLTSRTETTGAPGRINVSEDAYKYVRNLHVCIYNNARPYLSGDLYSSDADGQEQGAE